MKTQHHALYAAVLLACATSARAQEAAVELAPVTSTASAVEEDTNIGETRRDADALTGLRAAQNDASALLRDVPGMHTSGAGAISALPVLHGMADDRLRVAVDDVDLLPACPNHMNPPLSYIAPARVARVRVFAGTAPVSEGGDNIGGVVRVESAAPRFARTNEPRATGEVTGFARGNGNVRGGALFASLAGERLALRYDGAYGRGDNLHAARAFKAEEWREDGSLIRGDEIASTAFERAQHDLSLAVRHGAHQLRLDGAWQDLGFEGFPNQRMDMTGNRDARYTVRYQGETEHATLHARAWQQHTRHAMDFGRDRQRYGTGMPMRAQADNLGAALQADWYASARDTVRAGLEWHQYTLWDWWPPVGEAGVMQPDVFWNIYNGRRERREAWLQWEAQRSARWLAVFGARLARVTTATGAVQGYDNRRAALWGEDAARFNAGARHHADTLLDAAAQLRFTPTATQRYEVSLARKNRAPNLYQRYAWSTQPMAALMNNLTGDGNGYIGNPDLRPETAHTFAVSGHWQAAGEEPAHELDATAWWSEIRHFIDAERCTHGQCGANNAQVRDGFVLLRYVNQPARLVGLDVSARLRLRTGLHLNAQLGLMRGENRATGDGLYNIMPANLKLGLDMQRGRWAGEVHTQWVAAKTHRSAVRNEMRTAGYALVNARMSYETRALRLDFGVDNLFDRFYQPPLGGAYLGQGASMSTRSLPWGTPVPGAGRSVWVGLNIRF